MLYDRTQIPSRIISCTSSDSSSLSFEAKPRRTMNKDAFAPTKSNRRVSNEAHSASGTVPRSDKLSRTLPIFRDVRFGCRNIADRWKGKESRLRNRPVPLRSSREWGDLLPASDARQMNFAGVPARTVGQPLVATKPQLAITGGALKAKSPRSSAVRNALAVDLLTFRMRCVGRLAQRLARLLYTQ